MPNQNTFPTLQQISAGGVVHRREGSGSEILIIQVVPERRWQLPKGIVDDGETPEVSAFREVREETGAVAEIVGPIETIEYWYFSNHKGERVRYHKFVHFFLMNFQSGDVADHDDEVAEARWVNLDEAGRMLAFKSEREVVEKAAQMINAS